MSEAAEYASGGDRESGPQSEDAIRDDSWMEGLSEPLREAFATAHERASALGYAEPELPDESAWTHETIDESSVERRGEDALVCVYCEAAIPSVRLAYRKVVGWERQRRRGGTNAVRLRQPVDEYACATCIDAVAAGRDPGQAAIL